MASNDGTEFAIQSIRLNEKCDATLPQALWDELGLHLGDRLMLERRVINGQAFWVIHPCRPDWSWVGTAFPVDPLAPHDLEDVRASIDLARGAEERAPQVEPME